MEDNMAPKILIYIFAGFLLACWSIDAFAAHPAPKPSDIKLRLHQAYPPPKTGGTVYVLVEGATLPYKCEADPIFQIIGTTGKCHGVECCRVSCPKAGSGKVTVTDYAGKSASLTFTVYDPPPPLALNFQPSSTRYRVGDKILVTATGGLPPYKAWGNQSSRPPYVMSQAGNSQWQIQFIEAGKCSFQGSDGYGTIWSSGNIDVFWPFSLRLDGNQDMLKKKKFKVGMPIRIIVRGAPNFNIVLSSNAIRLGQFSELLGNAYGWDAMAEKPGMVIITVVDAMGAQGTETLEVYK
jgi:hypothetical protein